MSVLRGWLPAPEAEAALGEDPARFRAIFAGLREEWHADGDAGLDASRRSLKTLEWLSLVRSLEIERNKPAIEPADADAAVELLLEIVLASRDCLAARTRWAELAVNLVHDFRWKLTLSIDWRPFHALLCEFLVNPCERGYVGPLCKGQEVEQIVNLARRCRRFFPPEAPAEIWDALSPALRQPHLPEAFEALGLLVVLLPTRHVRHTPQHAWNAWTAEAVACWEGVVHCNGWDALWLTLFSRLAKHDSQGAIDWAPHLPALLSKCLWAFQVPVGTASAAPPFGRRPPESVTSVFQPVLTKRSPRAAKLLVWLLGRVAAPSGGATPADGSAPATGGGGSTAAGEGAAEPEDAVLLGLERLCGLLEQYYHPSNNGKWTGTLAVFLDRLTRHLGKRACLEQSPAANPECASSDDEGEEPAPGGAPANGHSNGHAPVTPARRHLSEGAQRRVALAIVQLASKAQYAKDRDMVSKACFALARMAAWVPDVVLPTVHTRFQVALEAVTAAHQLSIAVHTLGLVVRPLLLAGLAAGAGEGGEGAEAGMALPPREAAAAAVAAAMTAVLPGIDANDDRKTRAVFRFYCISLCSAALPPAPAGVAALPLASEEWLEELLARLFALLGNLDSPETRSDLPAGGQHRANHDCQSFLLTDDCMFRPMLELLLVRLPPELQALAVRRVARFATGTCLPSVAVESSILASAAARAAPALACQALLQPLLARLEGELPALQRAAAEPGSMQISKVQEAGLRWQLTLLSSCLTSLGPHLLPFRARLRSLLGALLALPTMRVAEPAGGLLEMLLHSLTSYYPLEDARSRGGPWLPGSADGGCSLEAWVSIEGRRVPPAVAQGLQPSWHLPSEAEVAFAEELLQAHLLGAARSLAAAGGAAGSAGDREALRVLLARVQACLRGAQAALPDFAPQHALPGVPLAMRARPGAAVGSAGMRAEAAACLLACGDFADAEVMQHLIEVTDEILSVGYEENADYSNNSATWKSDAALLHESPAAFRTHQQPGRWRHLRPRYMQAQRAQLLLKGRAAEAVFRPAATSLHPKPPLSWLPPVFKDLVARLLGYALQPYRGVASSAEGALRRAFKRYPCLIPAVLPPLLAALASQPAELGAARAAMDAPAMEEAWDHRVPASVLAQLSRAAVSCAATAATAADVSVADHAREEGRVLGAVALLSGPALTRATMRHLQPSLAVMAAVLATGVHRNPVALQSCTHYFALFCLRFLRPAGLDAPGAQEGEHLRTALCLLRDLGAAAPPLPVNWRFSLMANSLLVALLPPPGPPAAAALAQHFWPHVADAQPPQRSLAAAFFLFVLTGDHAWKSADVRAGVAGVVRAGLDSEPGWGAAWLDRLSHEHPAAASEGGGGQGKGRGRSKEDMLARVVGASLEKHLEWPRGRPTPAAAADGSFNLLHASLTSALAQAAPAQLAGALRPVLVERLTGPPARDDRPLTLAAVEVLAGLLASGVLFAAPKGGGKRGWDAWARQLLLGALADAPVDYGEVWACALRFAAHGLAASSPEGLRLLLAELLALPDTGPGGTAARVRWLKALGNLLCELNALGCVGSGAPPEARPVQAAGQAFQAACLARLRGLAADTSPDVRRHVASCVVVLVASLQPEGGSPPGAQRSELAASVQQLLDDLVAGMEEGAAAVAAAEGRQPGALEGAELLQSPMIARLGTGLQVINQSLRGGEGLCALAMRPTLLRMLPALLRTQEMAAPELQPLALEAKSAAATLKYLPLAGAQLGAAVDAIEAVSAHDLWPARAAALVFCQYFWFRHAFQLSGEQSQRCQRVVLRLMRDRKLEVQELAASTLSGMLKGLSAADFDALRADLLARTRELFPRGRRAAAARPDAAAAAERHAVVLGLKAFVLCTPYDVPRWLPEILLALVQASTQPPPIKTTVRKTLGEFKRTHEQAGLLEVRRMLSADEWETIQGIASPASYFA